MDAFILLGLLIISKAVLPYSLDANIFGLASAFLAYLIAHLRSKHKDKSMMQSAGSNEKKFR